MGGALVAGGAGGAGGVAGEPDDRGWEAGRRAKQARDGRGVYRDWEWSLKGRLATPAKGLLGPGKRDGT